MPEGTEAELPTASNAGELMRSRQHDAKKGSAVVRSAHSSDLGTVCDTAAGYYSYSRIMLDLWSGSRQSAVVDGLIFEFVYWVTAMQERHAK